MVVVKKSTTCGGAKTQNGYEFRIVSNLYLYLYLGNNYHGP